MSLPNLPDACRQILDVTHARLKTLDVGPGGELTIYRGPRTREARRTPYVWLGSEPLRNSHAPAAIRETWTWPLILGAVVQIASDPEDAGWQALELAAQARAVVLASPRDLGLEFVRDLVSVGLEPLDPRFRQGTVFGCPARVTVTFVAQ